MDPQDNNPAAPAEDEGFTVNDRRWWSRGKKADASANDAETEADEADEANEAGSAKSDAKADPRLIEYLQEQIHDRERKLEAAVERQRKALAELDRTKERIERDAERQLQLARRDLVRQQLDLLDDLERAIDAAGESSDQGLLDGVSLVARKFVSKLEELGVTREDPTGQKFDPVRHDAVSLVPVPSADQDGLVVGVIKKGYMIGDEALRPAVVAVGKFSG